MLQLSTVHMSDPIIKIVEIKSYFGVFPLLLQLRFGFCQLQLNQGALALDKCGNSKSGKHNSAGVSML